MFKPLNKKDESRHPIPDYQKSKVYGNQHKSWLRIYAIRIEPNIYCITGGAIKLVLKMEEREHLKNELHKLELAKQFLIDNEIIDTDSRFLRTITQMTNLDKINKLTSGSSNWIEEAKERQNNKAWLKHSRRIAIKILTTLREKGIKQTELAELLNVKPQQVNKIVKGRENLTLETISKLELALDINLMSTESKTYNITLHNVLKTNYVYMPYEVTKKEVARQKSTYKLTEDSFQLGMVNETCVEYG